MGRLIYRYYVGLAVPRAARDAANEAIADTTDNPADLQSFSQNALSESGEEWWWCSLPMTEENFARLPQLQDDLGGAFAVLREVVDGKIVAMQTIEGWLDSLGLVREVEEVA